MIQSNSPSTRHSHPNWISRSMELHPFLNWLSESDALTHLYSVSGVGGVGKTSLMREMKRLAEVSGHHAYWLDGRVCGHSPSDFVESLKLAIALCSAGWLHNSQGTLHVDPLTLLSRANAAHRIFVFIDNFEYLSAIEGWLLESFFQVLPEYGVLVTIAARNELSVKWKTHPHWASRLVQIHVRNFSRAESIAYLRSFPQLTLTMRTQIVRATKGHPLALAMAAEALTHSIHNDSERPPQRLYSSSKSWTAPMWQTLSGEFLRELLEPELQEPIETLCVLRSANLEVFNQFLLKQMTRTQYQRLSELSFIQWTESGLTIHDVARTFLLNDFRIREPRRFQEVQYRLACALCEKVESLNAQENKSEEKLRDYAGRLLDICVEAALPVSSYLDLTVDVTEHLIEPVRPEDAPRLQKILSHWCSYSVDPARPERTQLYQACLDETLGSFPEAIRVIRDVDGNVIAMLMFYLLYDETMELLYRCFKAEMTACFGSEPTQDCIDSSHTFYAVLAAYDGDHKVYLGEELVGALTRDALHLMGENGRCLLVVNNPELKQTLRKIGFQMRPAPDCDTCLHPAHVMELNFRQQHFVQWARQVVDTAIGPVPKQSSSQQIDADVVRLAMSTLQEPHKFAQTPLVAMTGLSPSQLRTFLVESLSDVSPFTLSPEHRYLLYITFIEHPGRPTIVATQLHMSKATYYRHLREALNAFAKEMTATGY